jgi:hypothetical protein
MQLRAWFSIVGGLAVAACSSNEKPADGLGSNADAAGLDPDASFQFDGALPSEPDASADAFWADDPPPKSCGAGGVTPVVPGGTPECPDDKNREGCPCTEAGQTAPCWPGYRRNRNRGQCRDGQTTCKRKGETELAWGACEGYVLPSGSTGAAACTCFSGGKWDIANVAPCYFRDANRQIIGAVSTVPTYDASGKLVSNACPSKFEQPTQAWSKTTLTVDCAGRFKLCFAVRAGDAQAPKDSDCTVAKQCVEGDYLKANEPQPFGELGAWINKDPACARAFDAGGGYGEMTVDGMSVECDAVQKVFQRVPYCPSKCREAANKDLPECKNCAASGGGSF